MTIFLAAAILLPPLATGQISNGNFELGYTGYDSQYEVRDGGGGYMLTKNPQSMNPNFTVFGDHTSGTGLMLVANAADDVRFVWRAQIGSPLQVGAQYEFSYWAASASAWDNNFAALQVSIDGLPLAPPVGLPTTPGAWTQIKYSFTANSQFPSITIRETTRQLGGADFAIDDIMLDISAQDDRDTDGDGLPDAWETNGVTFEGVFLNLPALGANPHHKDIFVELDWMAKIKDGVCDESEHSHMPSTETIRYLKGAFARAPVSNPDGNSGIDLHVDMEQVGGNPCIPETKELEQVGDTTLTYYRWTEFKSLMKEYFTPGRKRVFHYALFGHRLGGADSNSSGRALGIPGSSFFVADEILKESCPDTLADCRAGTFMHELGHGLGLYHGGGWSLPEVEFRPNYLSVMNYLFQWHGIPKKGEAGGRVFDYSRFDKDDLLVLKESDLNENRGLAGPKELDSYGTKWFCSGAPVRHSSFAQTRWNVNLPIDWDCDAVWKSKTKADINMGYGEKHESFNDWKVVKYDGGNIGGAGESAVIPDVSPLGGPDQEISLLEIMSIPGMLSIDVQPGSEVNAVNCTNKKGVIPVAILGGSGVPAGKYDIASAEFGASRARPLRGHIEDVNNDDIPDLLLHFDAKSAGIGCQASEVVLRIRGSAMWYVGSDRVTPVP